MGDNLYTLDQVTTLINDLTLISQSLSANTSTANYTQIGSQGPIGPQGPQGERGTTGPKGEQGITGGIGGRGGKGTTGTIKVGTVTELAPGAVPTVEAVDVGEEGSTEREVNFGIPSGQPGTISANYTINPSDGTGTSIFSVDVSNGNTMIAGTLDVNSNTMIDGTLDVNEPIITVGDDGGLDTFDRGIAFKYATEATGFNNKTGFMGFDRNATEFTFIPEATESLGVFSGDKGVANFSNLKLTDTEGNSVITPDGITFKNGAIISNSTPNQIDITSTETVISGKITCGDISVDNITASGDVNLSQNVIIKGGFSLGSAGTEFTISDTSDDITLKNTSSDKDIIFNVKKTISETPTDTEIMRLDGSEGNLVMNEAAKIEFRDSGLAIHSSDTGQLDIDADTILQMTSKNVDIDSSETLTMDSGTTMTLTSTNALTLTDGTATFTLGGTGATSLSGATTLDIDATGALTMDSATSIAIGTTADKPIDIDASTLDIDASGALTMDSATSIAIGTTADKPIDIDASTLKINTIDNTNITVGGTGKNLDIDASGALTMDSATSISIGTATSDVPVTIGHTTSEVTIGQKLNVTGDLTVTGNNITFGNGATIVNTDGNTLTITEQDVILSENLTVTGSTTMTGSFDLNNVADISNTLTLSKSSGTGLAVTSDASIGGILTVGDALSSSNILANTTTNDVNIFNTTTGTTTLGGGPVDIGAASSATTVKGTFNVDKAATFDSTVGITDILTVGNASSSNILAHTTTNDVNIFNTTTGKTTLGGGPVIIGATGEDITIKGNLKVEGTTENTGGGTVSGTIENSTNVVVTSNETTNETVYLTFVDAMYGNQGIEVDSNLTYNPNTNTLTAGSFAAGSFAGVFDGKIGSNNPNEGTFTTLTTNAGLVVTAGASIIGDTTDEITMNVKAPSGQSVDIFNVELVDGTDHLTVSSTGVTTASSLVATTAVINGGTIENTAIGATTPAAAKFTQLSLGTTTGDEFTITESGDDITLKNTVTDSDIIFNTTVGSTDTEIMRLDGSEGNLVMNDAAKIEFRDSGLAIHSSADGQLDIDADTKILLNSAEVDITADTMTLTSNDTENSKTAILSLDGGAISLSGDTTFDLDTTGNIQINSSDGTINIGNYAVSQNMNIGTGAAARTIAIGNSTVDTTLDLDAGTGGIDMDTTGQVNIASSIDGASAVVLTASAGGVDITATGASSGENIKDINITATGSSVNITSTEIVEDAIVINASQGGVDIVAAATKDVNISGGQVSLVSKDDSTDAISLTTNVGTTETIILTNTKGTSENAISLQSTAGGVDIDAAATKDVNISGGQVTLTSKTNEANAISLTTNEGNLETITVTNTKGTSDTAIALTSTLGGVAITGNNSTLTMKTDGDVDLTANTATTDNITVTNTKGTDNSAIALTSTAGGITMKVADEKDLTMGNADGDAYFKIASSATTDNEYVRIVNTNGTNAAAIELSASAGGVDINASSSITLDAVASSNITTSSGSLTLSGAGGIIMTTGNSSSVDIDGAAITIDGTTLSLDGTDSTNLTMTADDASAKKLTIAALNNGTGVANIDIDADGTINIDGGTAINIGTGGTDLSSATDVPVTMNASIMILDSTELDINTGTIDIDATSTINIDGTAINIGTVTSTVPVNIGNAISEVTIGDNLTVTGDLAVTGTITGNISASASSASQVTVTNQSVSAISETNLIAFVADAATATGTHSLEMDGDLTYNPSTGTLSATTFSGTLDGSVSTAVSVTGSSQSNITTLAGLTSVGTTAVSTGFLGPITANEGITIDNLQIDGNMITIGDTAADFATITSGTNGSLEISTTDASSELANITITADGTSELAGTAVTLNSSGDITLDADGGTITFSDNGVSLGTITSSGYSGNAATATTADACSGNASTVTDGVYTTNNLSALSSTTSAELASVISDETGSGSLVFATSPSLVTPVLGTPTSGDLTNCTGTASDLTAGLVTNGVYTTGDQTIGGTKTFSSETVGQAPTAANHFATKSYVDLNSEGLIIKDSVVVATTADITLQNTQEIDGVTLVTDDRVLVKNQDTATENGIYLVVDGTNAWTRATDMDTGSNAKGNFVFIESGTDNGNTGFVCTNVTDDTVGTHALTFTQFSGSGQVIAGDGLSKSTNTLSVDADLAISGGTIENSVIGGTTPAAGSFTTLSTSGLLSVNEGLTVATSKTLASDTVDIDGGAIDGTAIGATTASTGAFTTLSVNSITLTSGSFTGDTTITSSLTSVVFGSDITITINAANATQGTIITLLSDGINTYTLNNGNSQIATIAINTSTTIITTGTSAGDVVAYSNGTAVTFEAASS